MTMRHGVTQNARHWTWFGILLLAALLVSCAEGSTSSAVEPPAGNETAAHAPDSPRRGGTLNVALPANPIHFDPMLTIDAASLAVSSNIFESLYKHDEHY
jgi:ABC-type transport system substrate-binding protein